VEQRRQVEADSLYRKTRKDEMSTNSRSLKVMAPSRPAPPFEGILKLKTAPALTMSVVERMRSDSAKNIVSAARHLARAQV